MDIQALFDALGESSRLTRSVYHLTLGDAISGLKAVDPARAVEFDRGGAPTRPHSYRGYYSDLSLESGDDQTVGGLLSDLTEALGRTFEGYKGGGFTMVESTPLWMAPYGCCGRAIIGLSADGDGPVVLQTREVE